MKCYVVASLLFADLVVSSFSEFHDMGPNFLKSLMETPEAPFKSEWWGLLFRKDVVTVVNIKTKLLGSWWW